MNYLRIFSIVVSVVLGLSYLNRESLFHKTSKEEEKKTGTITIPLNNLNMPLVLDHVKDFSEVQVGMCLVKFKKCNFLPDDVAAFKKADCAINKFSDSYQVVDIDKKTQSILGARWYGTNHQILVGQIEEISLFHEKIYGFNDPEAPEDQKFYQGNCGQVQAFNDQNGQSAEKVAPMAVQVPKIKAEPNYSAGTCLVSISTSCPNPDNLEEWDKSCHPYSRSYKIEKVGKRNYLISTWYGYQNDFHELLGFKETADFSYFNKGFIEKDCNELKDQYPMGNYSAIYQFKNKFTKSAKSN